MNIPVDTLVCDTARIAVWQQDPAFDYNRELIEPQQNVLEWIMEMIIGLLGESIDSVMKYDVSWMLIAVVCLLLIVLAGWLLYKYRPGIFSRNRKERLDYDIEDDTIYGIDFDKAIAESLGRKDYREAVRLKYLQTLKMLTESGRIDWQLHKTPTQYTYEFGDTNFLRMTRQFLRIRYGNFEATPEVYEEMRDAQCAMHNSPVTSSHSPLTIEEKGGDA